MSPVIPDHTTGGQQRVTQCPMWGTVSCSVLTVASCSPMTPCCKETPNSELLSPDLSRLSENNQMSLNKTAEIVFICIIFYLNTIQN